MANAGTVLLVMARYSEFAARDCKITEQRSDNDSWFSPYC